MIIREALRRNGGENWNDAYSESNLTGCNGSDVIAKTRDYISRLRDEGEDCSFGGGPDYGLRNLKHLLDFVESTMVEGLLGDINRILKDLLARNRSCYVVDITSE